MDERTPDREPGSPDPIVADYWSVPPADPDSSPGAPTMIEVGPATGRATVPTAITPPDASDPLPPPSSSTYRARPVSDGIEIELPEIRVPAPRLSNPISAPGTPVESAPSDAGAVDKPLPHRVPRNAAEAPWADLAHSEVPYPVRAAAHVSARDSDPEPLVVPPVAPLPTTPAVSGPYAHDDWRGRIRGGAAGTRGTVYRDGRSVTGTPAPVEQPAADPSTEDSDDSGLGQKLAKIAVIGALLALFVVAFIYGPTISEWLNS